ncbi:Uma2 family endonuclease [Mediterraneibacter agrestimuris]|uniref:Uma2 family endonuclease n=1 Tax=Mediterraneibacter agrestimuris TaxID=2941333 RepID=UPI00203DFEB4|nr:Uma2 family endonuclease [Mediterraneibacter agrestimuris]
MTVDEMKNRKKQYGYSCEQIAELSGVPLGTVQKIFSGITKTPRYDTLRQLEKIFAGEASYLGTGQPFILRETQCTYQAGKKPGEYTLEDYYALPEERRAELIDGVIYDMAAPTNLHQQLIMEISVQLHTFISSQKGSCKVSMAPTDVQLDCDDKTMVQPDILVMCNRDSILRTHMYGAPDLVIEILSPSTRRKDMNLKYGKYAAAGVREYWMVDPDTKKIVVYDIEHEEFPVVYEFGDKIPVRIFHGECEIDFKVIYEAVRFLYGGS